jgi:hypothetical protein
MIAFIVRLDLTARLVHFSVLSFILEVFFPVVLVFSVSSIIPIFILQFLEESSIRLFISIAISVLSVLLSVFSVGVTNKERQYFIQIIKNKVSKN